MDFRTLDVLYQTADPIAANVRMDREAYVSVLVQQVLDGKAYTYRDGQTVFYVRYHNALVGDVHIFSNTSGCAMLRAARRFIEDARQRGLVKLEARTANRGAYVLAKRMGFLLEGYHRKAHITKDGLVDEYSVGLLL